MMLSVTNYAPENKDQLLEQRRQSALTLAEKLCQILPQDFGAKEVIVFGSLTGESPWHWHSDLDIAVSGMSENDLWQAYSTIEKIAPPWLKVDLVALENVHPQVLKRILKVTPMPTNKYLALKVRIEDEMIAIESNIETLLTLLAQAEIIATIALIPALASYINDFYKGCERISERVAVTLDGRMLRGENWHQQLLRQMAEIGGENRPPLWSGSLLLELDEYRKFWHLVMHTYSLELKAERVLELARNIQVVISKIRNGIAIFNTWLETQANQSDMI